MSNKTKKIIEHENQNFMFDGKFTKKHDDNHREFEANVTKVSEIDFNNSHFVADYLFNKDKRAAEALLNELEAQFIFGYELDKIKNKES